MKTPKSPANVTIYRNKEIKKDKRKDIPATLSMEDKENNKIFEIIERLAERLLKGKVNVRLSLSFDDTFAQNNNANRGNEKFVFKYMGKPIVVFRNEIMYAEADGSYANIYVKGFDFRVVYSKNLKAFDELIPADLCYRINDNLTVFGSFLNKHQLIDSLKVTLINGKELKISKSKAHGFWEWYKLYYLPITK